MSTIQAQKNISQGITRRAVSPTTVARTQTQRFVVRPQQSRFSSKKTSYNTGVAALHILNEKQVLISRGIIGLFAASLCLYLYMVVSIVVATVDRKGIEERVRTQSTELSSIESEYSNAVGSVTLADVKKSGYIDAGEATFAVRDINPTLTFRNE